MFCSFTTIMEINKEFLGKLLEQAVVNPRLRQNLDLRTSTNDNSQRILNALLPGTVVPIHRHPRSNENVLILRGKMVEVFYDENGNETERIALDPCAGNYGCVIPPGVWHTVEVLTPSVVYEAKDGKYGEDGSETLADFLSQQAERDTAPCAFNNCLGDLKKNIEYLVGMACQSGTGEVSAQQVSRVLNVPIDEVERVMREMKGDGLL